MRSVLLVAIALLSASLAAQEPGPGRTVCTNNCGLGSTIPEATGDTRTITEPVYPPVCTKLSATKFIVSTNTINLDPYNATCGSTGGTNGTLGCTGGTSYEPSSTATPTFTSDETDDVSALQAAINACPAGQAVEIVANGSKRSIVAGEFHLKNNSGQGVGLILDAGIHLYASRDRLVYTAGSGGANCGLVTSLSSFCSHWITAASTSGAGIYGDGVLDGRGWDLYLGATPSTTSSFYSARAQAYCNKRGHSDGLPNCTDNGQGNNSYGPDLLSLVGANNFTMYKTTVKDSANFNIAWRESTNGVFWGVKILSPFEVPNTDGWDPISSSNGTYAYGVVSNGDNHMSVKGQDNLAQNITFRNNQTGAGSGIVTGANPHFGIKNILVTDNVQNGNLNDSLSVGLQIGANPWDGGTTDTVTFQNDCMVNEARSIRIYPNYPAKDSSVPITDIPSIVNVLIRNVHVLASSAGKSGTFTFMGYDALHITTGQISNLTIDGTNDGVQQQGSFSKDQYGSWYIGPVSVPSSILTQFASPQGISVTTTGSSASSPAYPCTTSMWQPLVGDLNLQTPAVNNGVSFSGAPPYTLQAVVEPTTSVSSQETNTTMPNGSVQFLDNGTVIGTVSIVTGNKDGIYALFAVSTATSGTHVYKANYTGDTNPKYANFQFGSVTVVVP